MVSLGSTKENSSISIDTVAVKAVEKPAVHKKAETSSKFDISAALLYCSKYENLAKVTGV